jgi:hypothetical protein
VIAPSDFDSGSNFLLVHQISPEPRHILRVALPYSSDSLPHGSPRATWNHTWEHHCVRRNNIPPCRRAKRKLGQATSFMIVYLDPANCAGLQPFKLGNVPMPF